MATRRRHANILDAGCTSRGALSEDGAVPSGRVCALRAAQVDRESSSIRSFITRSIMATSRRWRSDPDAAKYSSLRTITYSGGRETHGRPAHVQRHP